MYNLLLKIKYFFINLIFRVRLLIFLFLAIFIALLCMQNTSTISIKMPFLNVEIFAPKFIFIILSYPSIKIIGIFFPSIKIHKLYKNKKKKKVSCDKKSISDQINR